MKLFYYTQKEKSENEEETDLVTKTGYSFNLEKVMMTYPDEKGLSIVLNQNVDKLNPVEYEYKIDPQTKQKVPVKIKKFEVTSEPMVVNLTEPSEIVEFFKLTGGPTF